MISLILCVAKSMYIIKINFPLAFKTFIPCGYYRVYVGRLGGTLYQDLFP